MFIGSYFISLHLIRSIWRNGGEPEIQGPYFCGLTQQTVLGNDGGRYSGRTVLQSFTHINQQ